jgi:hypothetical protein
MISSLMKALTLFVIVSIVMAMFVISHGNLLENYLFELFQHELERFGDLWFARVGFGGKFEGNQHFELKQTL